MSSFICDEKTYANIYSGLKVYHNSYYSYSKKAIDDCMQLVTIPNFDDDGIAALIAALYAHNVEAVNQRYGENGDRLLGKRKLKAMCSFRPNITIYQFIKSLDCLRYQMSEGAVPESELYKRIGKVITALCCDIVKTSDMYNAAEWG